jgi:general stress protein YciG
LAPSTAQPQSVDRRLPKAVAFAMQPQASFTGGQMAIEDRGFASMDKTRQREIASRGGKIAHLKGVAHEWTSEEAREAGRKGGIAHKRRRTANETQRTESQ